MGLFPSLQTIGLTLRYQVTTMWWFRLEEREQKIMDEIMNDEEYNSLQRPTSDGGPGFSENGASQVGLFPWVLTNYQMLSKPQIWY